jgi:RNA polymerase sigma-70 factor (ECF subfamily)
VDVLTPLISACAKGDYRKSSESRAWRFRVPRAILLRMTTAHLAMRVADHLWEFHSSSGDEELTGRRARTRSSSDASHTQQDAAAERKSRVAYDQRLIQRLKASDDGAWDEILHTYGAWLIRVAKTIVKSPDLAQDVLQDVFIWLWDRRTQLDIRGNIAPYLYRAVRNRAMNVRAHEHAEETAHDRFASDRGSDQAAASAPSEATALEFERAVQHALAGLSPKLREVFLLRVEHGWSNAEIADALGIAAASVRVQMYRATSALAERLTPWLESRE